MMVDHDHITSSLYQRDDSRLIRGTTVTDDDEIRISTEDPIDPCQSVAGFTTGQKRTRFQAMGSKEPDQDGNRTDPVAIVIAVDSDPFFGVDCSTYPLSRWVKILDQTRVSK
jgi:hypothetical protein